MLNSISKKQDLRLYKGARRPIRRAISLAMSMLLVFGCIDFSTITAKAEEPSYEMTGNGVSLSGGNATFTYGTQVSISLSGMADGESASFVIRNLSTGDEDPYESGTAYGVGGYKIGFTVEDSDGAVVYSCNAGDSDFGFTIEKANAPAPTGLGWTEGTTAVWSGPDGLSAVYDVYLYKDGATVLTKNGVSGTSVDLSEGITAEGWYTFAVKAIPTESSADLYNESDISEGCASSVCAVGVELAAGTGISAVSPGSFLLIPGKSGSDSQSISATPNTAAHWDFRAWSGVPSGMSLGASETSASNTLVADPSYSGETHVVITANGNESVPPVISSFEGSGGSLTATVSDNESGLAAYMFTTESDPAVVSASGSGWIGFSGTSQTVSHSLSAGGTWYFYAKDNCGNVAKSASGVTVNKINFANYFVNNSKISDGYGYFIGGEAFTLPVSSELRRDGYNFEGWYDNESFTGSPYTTITSHEGLADSATFYAKWSQKDLGWDNYPSGYTATYDGTSHSLTALTTFGEEIVTYTWFKQNAGGDFEAITGLTSNALSVRNVADSGTYKVTAHCAVIDDDGSVISRDLAGSAFTVTISKANLEARADDVTIEYYDEAPAAYTFKYYGLLGDDGNYSGDTNPAASAAITSAGIFTSSYSQGNDAGTYSISRDTGSGLFLSDNYYITTNAGTLTVSPKAVTEGSCVTATLDTTTFIYTGSAIRPVPRINDSRTDQSFSEDDYELSYFSNTNTGLESDEYGPRVRINFKNNYSGSITLHFEITQDSYVPVVQIENYTEGSWIYGDASKNVTLTGMPDDMTPEEKANYTVYYVAGTLNQDEVNALSTGSTTQPADAGVYTAFAIVAGTQNYASTHSLPCHFEISKKTITLTAASGTWEYDGNAHSNQAYSPAKESADQLFVKNSESFASIETVGSITNVGTAPNEIRYTLSSSTNADNYNIVCVDGELRVTPTDLPAPANCEWEEDTPGRASWVAVSKSGLTIRYRVKLFEHDDTTGVDTALTLGDNSTELITASTYVDFATLIHSRVDGNSNPKSYYFTVDSISYDGTNKNNYSDSDPDNPGTSGSLYTATVVLERNPQNIPGYDTWYERFDMGAIGDRITLISGESVIIYTQVKEGYSFDNVRPCVLGNSAYFNKVNLSNEGSVFRCRYTFSGEYASESIPEAAFYAIIRDTYPQVVSFEAENKDDLSGVNLSATLYDHIGIAGYRFVKVTQNNLGHYEIADDSTPWVNLQNVSGNYSVSTEVNEPGMYGVQVKDTYGNTLAVHEAISVYRISFDPGDGSGTMDPIFKAENTAPTLPLCQFTKEHYQFKYWSGANTGISVDGAPIVANTSDTLTAQWSNEKVNYIVKYFYMNGEGNYPDEPGEVAVFQGNHGDTIEVTESIIQKPRTNFTLDTSAGHNTPVVLIPDGTGADIVLNLYYRTGEYTITYSYRLPGANADTVTVQQYHYDQVITELTKPQVEGYDFVGWTFGGSGAAPERMPADNLTATGSFRAKDTTIKVVYHLETLGTGSNKTAEYPVDESHTEVLNAKNDDTIEALLTGEEASGRVIAKQFEGFTLEGVKVSYGADSGETLPTDIASSATGTAKYDTTQTLYINYYYTRNVYNLYVDVYKTNRETETNHIFRYTEIHQYQEELDDIEKFEDPAYYLGESPYTSPALDDNQAAFVMPSSFIFASYTDYSTGNIPEKMPAGDMSITKDVVSNENAEFSVKLYFETGTVGQYELKSTLVYDYPIGGNIHIVGSDQADTANDYYLNYNDIVQTVNNYAYYTHIDIPGESVEEGIVTDDDAMVLSVYFERQYTTATITYRYRENGGSDRNIATYKIRGKWGTSYTFDPDLLFDPTTAGEVEGKISALGCDVTTAVTYPNDMLSYDFRNNNYLISYTGRYQYFNSNAILTNYYPSYTFTEIGTGATLNPGYLAQLNANMHPGISDTITCYFSVTNTNYINISYNQIEELEEFFLIPRISNTTNLHDTGLDWWSGPKTTYPGSSAQLVPIGYEYDSNSDGTPEFYQLKIINKCAVVTGAPKTSASSGLDQYPASSAATRNYNYDGVDVDDINNLHLGCKHITGDYYFYDPALNTGTKTEAFGDEACVFKVDPKDRFLQGAYTSYSISTNFNGSASLERSYCERFLNEYKTAHAENGTATYDASAPALTVNNYSYGGAYISGSSAYLNVSYYYRGNCRLSFYFGGSIYSHETQNSYVYGTTVPKANVTCSNIQPKEGYDIVWYVDEARTTPIPESGLVMTQNRTVFGQYEKSTIHNMEYIYYQLADSVTINGNTYKYVTQDNLEAVSQYLENAGTPLTCVTTSEQINIGRENAPIIKTAVTKKYTLDGMPVFTSIERPTQTYSELKLSKGTAGYEEYYLGTTAGFYYDETNTANRSYGYVNTTPLTLKVYFARDQYTVEVLNNRTETDNAEYKSFSIGQNVTLTTPTKDGYTFDHWDWKKWDGTSYVNYTPTIPEGEVYFRMPDFNLRASAVYTAAEFEQKVCHFFQTEDSVYLTNFISSHQTEDLTASVTYDDNTYANADVWGTADAPTAVRIVINDVEYYFNGATASGNSISVSEANLVAAVTRVDLTSDDSIVLRDLAFADNTYENYDFSYVLFKDALHVTRYGADATLPGAKYGMTLELYYPRTAHYAIELLGLSLDGGEAGLTLIGAGAHFFGESIRITAVMSEGYSFAGWYKTDDIENGGIKEGAVAVSNNLTTDVVVRGNASYTAVVRPNTIVVPKISFSGKNSYTYGYSDSSDNSITAIVSTNFTNADSVCAGMTQSQIDEYNVQASKTKITGYQWYLVTTDTEGNQVETIPSDGTTTASTYRFRTGKNAGAYVYKCKIMYERTDNGRTGEVSATYTVTVNKADMSVDSHGYTGTYDNNPHSISVSVTSPSNAGDYEIYYHPDTEITAENLNTLAGVTGVVPTYTHVKYDEAAQDTGEYSTYFYIKDKTGNFNDYASYNDVHIYPKTVSIRATAHAFSKMYDGDDHITGNVTTVGSDLYTFAQGDFYTIQGYIDGDTDTQAYVLNCNAAYNSEHVRHAKVFTVEDMEIVNKNNGEVIHDYEFPMFATLSFTGTITPRPLDIEWVFPSETTIVEGVEVPFYVYNGSRQGPEIRVSDNQTYPIPDVDSDIRNTLSTSNKQDGVGTYTAVANVTVAANSHYESSDYSFSVTNQKYVIGKRPVSVTPTDKTVTYNGTARTITEYTTSGLVNGHMSTAQSVKSYVDAGTYADMSMKNLVITDAGGRIKNDNYEITYETGTLTIEKCPVTVSGITVDAKEYDGTTATDAIDVSAITFAPELFVNAGTGERDTLLLDVNEITAVFADYHVSNSETVNLTISADALINAPGKDCLKNYYLDVANSQDTATAAITATTVRVKAKALSVVYGESASFGSTLAGFYENGEFKTYDYADVAAQITGSPAYLIKVNSSWQEYVPGSIGVGTYEIKVDVSGMSSSDYQFDWEEDSDVSVLTVTQRPVSISAAANPDITKVYDKTTAVPSGLITKTEDYVFDGVLDAEAATFDLDSFDAVFNSKDTATATKVILTNLTLNNDNYSLTTDADFEISASITKVDLSLSVGERQIVYGGAEISGYSYSDEAGKYHITLTGFLDGEDESDLTGTFIVSDTYDASDAATRGVGDYDVSVAINDSFDNDNYRICVSGTPITTPVVFDDHLHVVKKTLTIKPNDKVMKYKIGVEDNPGHIPVFDWTYEGFVEGWDSAESLSTSLSVLTSYVTERNTDNVITPELGTLVGEYDIKVSGTPVLDNYTVVKTKGKFTVIPTKIYVTVGNLINLIEVTAKEYDGTTAVLDGQITVKERDLLIDDLADQSKGTEHCLLPSDAQYLKDNPGEVVISFDFSNCAYSDKNVGTDKNIVVEYELGPYLRNRYAFDETDKNAKADIYPAPLTITPVNQSINYGKKKPTAYTYTATGLKNGETIETTADFSGSLTYSVDSYSSTAGSFSPVNTTPGYPITVSGITNSNYDITFETGYLQVKKTRLSAKVPTWSTENPGVVSWQASSKIGDVTVAGYQLTLLKNGSTVETANVGSSIRTYDFSDKMHEASGTYTVKVKAIASETGNAGKANVGDSTNNAVTADSRKVIAVCAAFGTSNAGKADDITIDGVSGDPIYLSFASDQSDTPHRSLNAIQGETLNFKAEIANGTGYTPAATLSDETLISFNGTPAFAEVNSKHIYSGTITLADDISDASATAQVTVDLSKISAECSATIAAQPTSAYYGFNSAEAPIVTATPQVVEGDNVGLDGYDFEYTWQIRDTKNTQFSASGYNTKVTDSPSNHYQLPTLNDSGRNLETGGNRYWVRCTVKATRKDNGESKTITTGYVTLTVQKGTYTPGAMFHTANGNVSSVTWAYGEERVHPVVTNAHLLEEDIAPATVDSYLTWQYSTSSTGPFYDYDPATDETIYTNVGTYYVRGKLRDSTNYPETFTPAIPYTITKAKLDTPTGLSMTASPTAPYGLTHWDQVTGPVENAAADGKSASNINVKYQVELKIAGIGRPAEEALPIAGGVRTVDDSASPSCDFTDIISDAGTYYLYVKAIVDGNATDKSNCDDSDAAEYRAVITIGAGIESNLANPNSFEKEYDGQPLEMRAIYENTTQTFTYQWMKNGQEIAGATSDTYSISYVEDNAKYVCRITVSDGTIYYTKVADAKINPRKIVLTSPSESWVYDAQTHAKNDTSLISAELGANSASTGTGIASGDSIDSISLAETITDVSTKPNTISNVVIKRGSKVVFDANATLISAANNNYEVTYNNGTLGVTRRPVTITAVSESRVYNGTALTNDGFTILDGVTQGSSLATGHTVTATVTGSQTAFGQTVNVVSNVAIKDGSVDKTSNYDITLGSGTLEITKKAVTITGTTSSKAYDGTPLTFETADELPSVGYTNSTLATGDSITALTLQGTITNRDGGTNGSASVNNTPSGAVIKNAQGEDVTGSYDLTYVPGTLTITKRAVILSADNKLGANGSTYGTAIKPLTVSVTSGSDATLSAASIISELSATAVTTLNNRSAVGTHTGSITVNYTDPHGNYDVTTVAGNYEVTKATLTADVNNFVGIYDGADHGISVTPHALFADESPVVYYATTALNESNYLTQGNLTSPTFTNVSINGGSVDSYTVYYYVVMANYDGLAGTGTVTINKRPITFTSADATKVYDGTALVKNSTDPAAPDYTYTPYGTGVSLVTGDSVSSISITGSQTNAGTGANTISGAHISNAAFGDITDNYNISYVPGNLVVTKRPITVTADSATKMYDGTPLTESGATVTAGSLVSGDTVTAVMTSASTITNVLYSGSTVTSAPNVIDHVTITTAGGADVTNNYEISTLNGGLTITRKPATITGSDSSKVYDGTALTFATANALPAAGFTHSTLATGDSITALTLQGTITNRDGGTNGTDSVNNTPSGAVIKNAQGVDVTGSYELTYVPGTLSITRRAVTLAADNKLGTEGSSYGSAIKPLTVSVSAGSDTTLTETNIISELSATAVTTLNNRSAVGTHTGSITVNYTDTHGNYVVTTTAGNYEVTKATLTADVNNYVGIYDGADHGISVTPHALFTDESPAVFYATTALNESNYISQGSLTSPTFTNVVENGGSVGSYTVYYYVVLENYDGLAGTGTVTINKRPVTFTSANATKVYDGTALVKNSTDPAAPDYTYTPYGTGVSLVSGDSVSSISITGSQTDAGIGANTISGAHIVNSGSQDITGNYDISYTAGNLVVTKRPITVTADSATKVYDGTPLTESGATVTTGSLVSGDTVAAVMTAESTITNVRYSGNSITSAPNVIDTVTITAAGGADVTNNYEISKANGGLTITRKPATITGSDSSKVYDGTALTFATANALPVAGFTHSTLATGDSITALTLQGSITNCGTGSNTPSGAVIENAQGENVTGSYELTYVPGTLTITRRAVTLKADNKLGAEGSSYGSAIKPLTVSVTSGSNATLSAASIISELSATAVTTLNNRSAVGTHTGSITVNYTDPHGNYNVTTVAGDYEVTNATLTADVNNYVGIYDGAAHGISVTPHGVFTDESPVVYYATTALNESNYLSDGSTTSPAFTNVVMNGGSVGSYTVYYYVVLDNYTGLPGTGTVTINKRPVTFTSASATKVYDGTALVKNNTASAAPDYTYTAYGTGVSLVPGDSVSSISITGSQTDAGTGANTISGAHIANAGGQDMTDNYNISYVPGNLVVTRRPITVTAGSATKMYDGTPLTESGVTVTAGSLVSGDTVTAVMTSTSTITNVLYSGSTVTSAPNVIDTVTVTAAGGADVTNNYEISTANGGLTITKKPLSITAKDFAKQYDGTAFTKAGTYSLNASDPQMALGNAVAATSGLVAGDELDSATLSGSITYFGTTGTAANTIGNAVVKRAGADITGNYEITYNPGTLSIAKRPITVTAGSAEGANAYTYDGSDHVKTDGYGVTSGTLVSGDSVSAVMTANSKQKDVGTGTNTIREVTVTNASGTNITSSYDISKATGRIEVVPRTITIAPDAATGRYGDTPSGLGWHVVSGSIAVPGEITATVSSSTDENTAVGTYADALSVTATNPNYIISTTTADYTIEKRNITIVAGSKTEIFQEGSVLTCDEWSLASGSSFAPNDSLDSILITGSIDELGSADNIASDAVIKRSGVDVTGNYEITYAKGTLSLVNVIIVHSGGGSSNENSSNDDDDNQVTTYQAQSTPNSDTGSENKNTAAVVALERTETEEPAEESNNASVDESGVKDDFDKNAELVEEAEKLEADKDRTIEVIGTTNKDVGCAVVNADTERMSKELLTKGEYDSFMDGEDLIFRVELTETNTTDKKRLDAVKGLLEHADIKGVFESDFYVKIGGGRERKIDEDYSYVGVSVKMPEELIQVLLNGGSILRITIDENGVPLAYFADFDVVNGEVVMNVDNFSTYVVVSGETSCYIHWLILLILLLSVAIALLYFRNTYRKEEKLSREFNIQLVAVVALNLAGAIIAFAFGECKWDIYAGIAMLIISASVEGGGKYVSDKGDSQGKG